MTRADSLRKPERFQKMLDACLADLRGRENSSTASIRRLPFLAGLADKLRLDTSELQQQGLSGKLSARRFTRPACG